jgi:integral membrane protein (TIGR01906 family)
MKFLLRLASFLMVISVPLAATGAAVRFAFSYRPLYEYDINQYQIATYTGIDRSDLERVTDAFIAYFNNSDREINLEVQQRGIRKLVFNDKEVNHMVDVKNLVRAFYRVQEIALVVLVGLGIAIYLRERRQGLRRIGGALIMGGVLTVTIVISLATLSLVDFDSLFLTFHEISFPGNTDWLLDPRIDNLIAIFPEPFWLDATLLLGFLIVAQALLAIIVGWQLQLIQRRTAPASTAATSAATT